MKSRKSSLEYIEEDFDLKERNQTSKFIFQTVYLKIEDILNRYFWSPQTFFNFRWSKIAIIKSKLIFQRIQKNVIILFWDKILAQKYFFSSFEPVFNWKIKVSFVFVKNDYLSSNHVDHVEQIFKLISNLREEYLCHFISLSKFLTIMELHEKK